MQFRKHRQLLLDFDSASLPKKPTEDPPSTHAGQFDPAFIADIKIDILEYLESRPGERIGLRELCRTFGHSDVDCGDPLPNPVHLAAKELRDAALIQCADPEWGEPLFSALEPNSDSFSPSEIVCQGPGALSGEQTISPVEEDMNTLVANTEPKQNGYIRPDRQIDFGKDASKWLKPFHDRSEKAAMVALLISWSTFPLSVLPVVHHEKRNE